MKKLNDLKSERASIIEDMEKIVNSIEGESRSEKTDGELAKWKELNERASKLSDEIDLLQRQDELNKLNLIDVKVDTPTEKRSYNLFKALDEFSRNSLSGYEKEVHEKASAEFSKRGLILTGLGITQEVRAAITAATGAGTVKTDTANEISIVKTPSLLDKLGVKRYNNLIGNFKLPNMSEVTASFVSEEGELSEYTTSISSVTLTPRRIGGTKKVTKEYLAQTSPELQLDLINDFNDAILRGVSKEIFTQINSSVTPISGYEVGAKANMTWADILKLEGEIETDFDGIKFVTSKKVMSKLKGTSTDSGSGRFIWEGNVVNGYDAIGTSLITYDSVSGGTMVLGNFKDIAVGDWGPMELIVDPYTSKNNGFIEITANALMDVKVVNDNSFSVIRNASA